MIITLINAYDAVTTSDKELVRVLDFITNNGSSIVPESVSVEFIDGKATDIKITLPREADDEVH